jgi:hypothetical protein
MNNLLNIYTPSVVNTPCLFRKFLLCLTTLLFAFSACLITQIPAGYYDSVKGLKGQKLKDMLHEIAATGHRKIPYTGKNNFNAWDVLMKSDRDSMNSENVILFYTGKSFPAAQKWNNGKGWNKEHVWAKAYGKFKKNSLPFNDLHNLKPSKTDENSKKGTKDFDNGGIQSVLNLDGSKSNYDNDSWEPRPQIKGDVARILFYMSVRYEGDDGNPFIDHPEFADLIWGSGPMTKTKNACMSSRSNKPLGIVNKEFPKSLNPTGVLLSEKGEKLREFEFAGKSKIWLRWGLWKFLTELSRPFFISEY